MSRDEGRLYPALLRHFRQRRGLSQLDLSLAADVSARHVSFLETGRAEPSREMVLRLASALDVPLRDQNQMLQAAGFTPEFAEPGIEGGLSAPIESALTRMLALHEPYPMVVMNRLYDVYRTNTGAQLFFGQVIADPSAVVPPLNLFRLAFDPRLARHAIVDWERTARALLSRLHRESLARAGDASLAALVRDLLEYPDVPEDFRQPDFSLPSDPVLGLRLRCKGVDMSFLVTVTVFSAPQNVTLEELRIESYFPLDDATARACEALRSGPRN
ncbi:MAG: helix-turn-helix transcriptional regulator [Polyangiaceae bacterium]